MKKFRVIEHRIVDDDLTEEQANNLIAMEEHFSDLNEVWFEKQEYDDGEEGGEEDGEEDRIE